MKFYPLPVVLVASLSLHAWGALPYQVRHSLDELRIRHRDGEVSYQQYKAELSGDARDKSVERRVDVRLGEFRKCAERLSLAKPQPLPGTVAGASKMWASRTRSVPAAVDSSAQFNCGPKKSVTPSTGEYGETDVDFAFSGRGGLSFEFVRRYASYGEFDCGFGKGWDHDFNAGIIFNADDVNAAESCVLFWQGNDVNFKKHDGKWAPEFGHFFSMEITAGKVYLFTPLLMRIEFEPAVEKQKGVGRWRLSAVASRHDKWTANRIELEYLKDCDRIKSITGARGERIDFAYDAGGHIVGINSQRKSVRYEYEADRLVRVRHSPVALSAQGGRDYCEPIVSYDYVTVGGGKKVCRKSLGGQSYCLEISYDDQGRVIRCGYVSKDAKQMWQLTYKPNETIVESPKPSADVHYFWGGTPHPSLPCRLEIPAQKAVIRYVFNADYMMTEEVDALGVKTIQEYDSGNPNPIMRGNLLSERRLAGTGVSIKWCEFGVRTSYEKEIALPIKIESYQLETNGVEEIVKREIFKYRRSDYSLCEKRETGGAEKGGVLMRYVCNRYGEVGLERDAKNNVTIYEYAESLPKRVDFDFMQGSPSNGGLLVREIEDANEGQKNNACRELNTSVIRNEIVRVKPCALETLYAWDCDGNQIREKRGFHEKLSLFNEKGAALAVFDNGAGLSLTEYHPDGRAKRVLGEFCPSEDNGYRGQSALFFEGCFSMTSFVYDSLGQMSARSKTDEKIDGVEVKDAFVRYPNGKIAKIINPSGVTREDLYDYETGFLVFQVVKGESEDIPLGRIIERFPGGAVRVYEDKLGAVWTNRLDAFGRIYETVSCLGTTKRELKDALGRVVAVCEFDSSKIYSRSENTYLPDNGFVESERRWKSDDGKSGEWIEIQHHLYDEVGNEVGNKGVHKDSWSYSLFDGIGRKVATLDPVGGYSIVVYDADREAYTYTYSVAQKDKKEFKQGVLRVLDGAGRAVETIPVDSKGNLARGRHVVAAYNLIGQVVRTESMDLSSRDSEYNSLGWIVKETTSPLNAKQGECPIVVSTAFRADGKTIARELGNNALALFGDKDNVRPEFVDAPQITRYYYDEYGRLQKTEHPDGLMVATRFNRNSLPSQMTWTHASSTNILRQIEFFYSPLGQVQKLVDGMTKNILQEFSYDGAGLLTKAVDWNGGEQVVLKSKYDTCGQKIENQTILSGHAFPVRRFDYDPVKGIAQAEWTVAMSGAFWRKEMIRTDAAGRQTSITLDADSSPAVEWEYMGRLPRSRSVRDSAIDTEYTYTSLGELSDVRMFDSFTHDELGCLGYAYGQQGQMLFSSAQLKTVDNAGDYQFSAYSHFDDFRRLTGQNAESIIPDKNDWRAEWQRVFGISERSLSNQDTMRMRYDQANNIWVKYQGEEFNEGADKFNKDQSPIFTSSAKPFPAGVAADKRELASNREVSRASFDKEGSRSAEVREYDLLGNLVEYKGHYWNGTYKIPVKWTLEYDPLGRLMRMEAKSDDDSEYSAVKKGEVAGVLNFAYDAQNRRVVKRVIDRPMGNATTNIAFTVYKGTCQALVYEKDDDELKLIEEYLWGVGARELIMAAMTKVEKNTPSWPVRYAFQQDSGFNTVIVTKNEAGRRIPVSVSSYLGFGENATRARIKDVKSSMGSRNKEYAYNNQKDDKLLTAAWLPGKSEQFIELKMHDARKLSLMTIWGASGLPRDFLVYVLPEGVDSPDEDGFDLDKWHLKNQDHLSSVVMDGHCQGYQKQDSYYSPYKVVLGDRRGDRIVIAWRQELDSVKIKEIEVVCAPDNPSAIAFAGQWLDRETGLYYQINRYRIAGSDKFISPDPLGFAAGDNLYAYANGNPLEWHDPDGRTPVHLVSAAIGAAVGAVFGGGVYALRCWLNGEEFSWVEFGIQTFIGAASGAIAGLTMGAFNPWAGQVSSSIAQAAWHGAARGAVSGLASGAFSGAADPVMHGVINGDSAGDITERALKGAGVGALSGATIGAGLGAAAGAYAQWNLQRPEPGAVWRVCRPDENPSNGLVPKDPTATKSLNSHVGSGSRSGYKSQYISTTKDYATAYKWAQKTPGARIVKINTSKLSNNIYDFTDPAVREKYLSGRWSNNFAKGSQEVVIDGPVQAEAITEAEFLGFDF